nr:ABC transporter ATP-binding protein [Xanthobacteraceae bacterium]
VIMMKRGKIVDDESLSNLITRYGRHNLEEVFLDVARGRGKANAQEAAQ